MHFYDAMKCIRTDVGGMPRMTLKCIFAGRVIRETEIILTKNHNDGNYTVSCNDIATYFNYKNWKTSQIHLWKDHFGLVGTRLMQSSTVDDEDSGGIVFYQFGHPYVVGGIPKKELFEKVPTGKPILKSLSTGFIVVGANTQKVVYYSVQSPSISGMTFVNMKFLTRTI